MADSGDTVAMTVIGRMVATVVFAVASAAPAVVARAPRRRDLHFDA
jgi:hypothetical protein